MNNKNATNISGFFYLLTVDKIGKEKSILLSEQRDFNAKYKMQ